MIKYLYRLIDKKLIRYQSLEKHLKHSSVIAPRLSEQSRSALRQKIMNYARRNEPAEGFGYELLIQRLKALAKEITPRITFRMFLRSKLMRQPRAPFTWFFAPRRLQKILAMVILLIFGATVFFNFGFIIPRAEASFTTVLEEISGAVTVARGSTEIFAVPGFLLEKDDIVRTANGSKAVIRFLDQSVTRLDEDTEIKISRLFINPNNKTQTIVELVLNRGQLWTRVVSLIDDLSRFQVKAENALAVAKKKAAFNISVQPNKSARVSAIHNNIDLVVATGKKVVETTISKGFSVDIKPNTTAIHTKMQLEKLTGDNKQWLVDNLAQDKEYMETVKQEAQDQLRDQVKMTPDNPLYAVKELSETTRLALTFNDLGKQKKLLAAAQEKLAEAHVMFGKGDRNRAFGLLSEFQKIIFDVSQWIQKHQTDKPTAALELHTLIDEMFNAYQKQLSLVLPSDASYVIKQIVVDTQLHIAPTPIEKTNEQVKQASDKLLQAHDLMERGDTKAAQRQLEEYTDAISEVVSEVQQLPTDQKEAAVSALLGNRPDDLKALESLPGGPMLGTSSLPFAGVFPLFSQVIGSSTPALDKTVSDAKIETLTRLGEAVSDVKRPGIEVLQRLQDIANVDVNGKPVVDVILSPTQVTPRRGGSKTRELRLRMP